MRSIRGYLLLWLSLGMGVTIVVAGTLTYVTLNREFNRIMDYQLEQIALTMRHPGGGHMAAMVPEFDEKVDTVVRIWSAPTGLIYDSDPQISLPQGSVQGLSTITVDGESWRIFLATWRRGNLTVQVGQSLELRRRMALAMMFKVLIPLLLSIPVFGFIILFGVKRGLHPLWQIASALGEREASSLEPLPEGGLPVEIAPLVEALNDLLARLKNAIEKQRKFIADAAHELRTPLTGIGLQAQIAERAGEDDERKRALELLREGVRRSSHLVEQLLALARVEFPVELRRNKRVELFPLLKQVLEEYVPIAGNNGVDLGLTGEDSLTVMGEERELRLMLANLVENAVRYTPSGGRVDVRICGAGRSVEIEDTGPGIPEEERERVFDRFYRGRGTKKEPGSGLGLSIVKDIADGMGSKVTLADGRNGRGLKVIVTFLP